MYSLSIVTKLQLHELQFWFNDKSYLKNIKIGIYISIIKLTGSLINVYYIKFVVNQSTVKTLLQKQGKLLCRVTRNFVIKFLTLSKASTRMLWG